MTVDVCVHFLVATGIVVWISVFVIAYLLMSRNYPPPTVLYGIINSDININVDFQSVTPYERNINIDDRLTEIITLLANIVESMSMERIRRNMSIRNFLNPEFLGGGRQ
ncbi:2859_t:CDS:2 [Paraglomus occultum]|uniref:2859_t:CDS:1 n=1 Tax=Paraglomus occultum TaxID=144539 RepID=A0A9N9AA90_9GLOM|nr:2859_t:CDS:2 [Paraglomus occultum]